MGRANITAHLTLSASHTDVACFVAEEDGELVGFVVAELISGTTLPGRAGEVAELYVLPGRNRDPARERLANEAISWLRENGAGLLFVHRHRDEAPQERPLWRSLGFDNDMVRFSRYDD